jgi:hypothetical protein
MMYTIDDTANEEFEVLLTYASNLENDEQHEDQPSAPSRSISSGRHSLFLKCEEHDIGKSLWSISVNGKCDKCISFTKEDSLPQGKLSTKFEILCYLLTQNEENKHHGQTVVTPSDFASKLALHWIFCNVYPQTLTTIRTN